MKKFRLLLLMIVVGPAAAFAQSGIDDLMKGSVSDAKYLAEGYISPMMKTIGYGLNQGWYNTAKPHKTLGVDLTFSVNPVFVPSSDQYFKVDNTKLQNIYLSNDVDGKVVTATGSGNIPTVFGPKKPTTYTNKAPLPVGTVGGPQGIGLNIMPVPTLNLGIGLPKGFDLKFRYVPKIDLAKASGDNIAGTFSLIGAGVMHDFKQYIPGIKALPFDLSAFVGYTKMNFDIIYDSKTPSQHSEMSSSATTIQAIISKKLAVLTAYGAVGYNMATTKLAVKGNYDLNGNGSSSDPGEKDPVNLSVDSTGPRLTAGIRLKLGPLTLHGDYTLQKFNAVSAGIGISVR